MHAYKFWRSLYTQHPPVHRHPRGPCRRAFAGRQQAFVVLIAVAVVLAVLLLLSLLVIIILVLWGARLNKQKRIIMTGIHANCAIGDLLL